MSLLGRLRASAISGRLLATETSREGDRATTLELFFDLVYAFAFTQVTALMAHGHSGLGVLQGLIVLVLLWGPWSSFAWLANQAHADRGATRIAMMTATGIMFVAALAVLGSFRSAEHGDAAAGIAFGIAFLLVQAVHMVFYLIAAGSDIGLRRQVIRSEAAALLPSSGLLILGAALGPPWQLWLWLAAAVGMWVAIYATSRNGDWRIQSAAHFAERHALVVLLALGESVVAIGTGAADLRIDAPVIVGSVLAIGIGLGMWWTYFAHLSEGTERAVSRRSGVARAQLATETYTYLHLALIAGIVLAALGIETTMHEVSSTEPLGWFAACGLGGGIGLYLAGTGFVWRRVSAEWSLVRFAGAAAAVLVVPLLAAVPALGALGVELAVLIAVIAAEQALGRRGKRPAGRGAGDPPQDVAG